MDIACRLLSYVDTTCSQGAYVARPIVQGDVPWSRPESERVFLPRRKCEEDARYSHLLARDNFAAYQFSTPCRSHGVSSRVAALASLGCLSCSFAGCASK